MEHLALKDRIRIQTRIHNSFVYMWEVKKQGFRTSCYHYSVMQFSTVKVENHFFKEIFIVVLVRKGNDPD